MTPFSRAPFDQASFSAMATKLFRNACLISIILNSACGFNTDDQVNSALDYGTFENPSSYVRPRFRYWIPDASVDLKVVADDFRKAKEIGMGGLELLGCV